MIFKKEEIIKIGMRLYNKDLTVATSGNISVRTESGILITSTGSTLGSLKHEDVVLIDYEGNTISGKKASSEKMLHVEIYKKRPDVNAIIHTHPVFLTTFAACHLQLKDPIMSENILYFEDIPLAPYAMPSTVDLAVNTAKYLENRDVVMMANHGAIAVGTDLEHAYLKMETAEYYAKVEFNARLLGGAKPLSEKDVNDLLFLKSTAK